MIALSKLAEFYATGSDHRPTLVMSNSRIGILLLCSAISSSPILSLEFDCRGFLHIDKKGDLYQTSIEIGEIKSTLSGNTAKAIQQITIRLRAIEFANQIILAFLFRDLQVETFLRARIFYGKGTVHDPIEERNGIFVHYEKIK
jgi:hypothetical protein